MVPSTHTLFSFQIIHAKSDEQRQRLSEAVKTIFLFRSLDHVSTTPTLIPSPVQYISYPLTSPIPLYKVVVGCFDPITPPLVLYSSFFFFFLGTNRLLRLRVPHEASWVKPLERSCHTHNSKLEEEGRSLMQVDLKAYADSSNLWQETKGQPHHGNENKRSVLWIFGLVTSSSHDKWPPYPTSLWVCCPVSWLVLWTVVVVVTIDRGVLVSSFVSLLVYMCVGCTL